MSATTVPARAERPTYEPSSRIVRGRRDAKTELFYWFGIFPTRSGSARRTLNTVCELLWQGDIMITLRYSHPTREYRAETVARLRKSR